MKDELSQYKDDIVGGIAAFPQDKQTLLGQSLKQKLADGHTLVAQTLKRLGITHVYCVSGTPSRETFATCGELGIRLVIISHLMRT